MLVHRTILYSHGRTVRTGDETTPLLDVVRSALGIRSTARGCGNGLCGSCRVLLEGEIVNTCTLLLRDVPDGARLVAFEDVSQEPEVVRAVAAFNGERPTRCTLCVPAIGVTAAALARRGKTGDPDAIEAALETAACMCTGRASLRRSLLAAKAPDLPKP